MRRADALYPAYGFRSHVGYITPEHSAVVRRLKASGVADDRIVVPRSTQFDLTDMHAVKRMYDAVRPVALYLYLDTPQGWVLAQLPLAVSIWADGGQ